MIIPTNTSGGAERVMCQLANGFVKRGIKVIYANFDSTSSFYPLDEQIISVKMGLEFKSTQNIKKIFEAPIKETKRFFYIRNLIIEYKPDVVLPFLEMAEMLTIPNCLLKHVPFCVSLRNDYKAYFWYMKLLSKLTYKKAKLVVCQTEKVRRDLLATVSCKTTVIYNPIDKDAYDTSSLSKSRRKVIINVGRLTAQKNQKLLIDAFAKIARDFPDYELHIFGKGELKQELQDMIEFYDLSAQIKLMGVVPNVLKENRDVSLFVMSSNFEGFPNTLVEAMANGIPAISTDFNTGAARTLLKDGNCGWLVPVGGCDELASAMKEALSNKEIAEKKANQARCISADLATEKICDQWLMQIENALR